MMNRSIKASIATGIVGAVLAFGWFAPPAWTQQPVAGDPPAVSTVAVAAGTESFVLAPGGSIERLRYFSLANPARLVVDAYGTAFEKPRPELPLSGGFKRVRAGLYSDKMRYVFDAEDSTLPSYTVEQVGGEIRVAWQPGTSVPTDSAAAAAKDMPEVTALNFRIEGSRSLFEVNVSRLVVLEPARVDGNTVIWGVRNADIRPSLRRYIDAGAFPSIVKKITPYLVGDDVRFAVELREPVRFELTTVGEKIVFSVENGAYAFAPPSDATAAMPALVSGVKTVRAEPVQAAAAVSAPVAAGPVEPAPFVQAGDRTLSISRNGNKSYRGRKISLIFDDADIRNILQLIAEVSNLNVIATEEVKGNLTLRLIDVPWDQALDVILEITELGTLREGNILRVLPKKQIRDMVEAELTAEKAKEKLEPLETKVFEVSYSDLTSVLGPVEKILSERGKAIADNRNKQLIISDVPAKVAEIANLVRILDTAERQVMIEARIVEVNSSFVRNLGVNWGLSYRTTEDLTVDSIDIGAGGNFSLTPPAAGVPLLAGGGVAGIQFGTVGLDPWVLDLRISALETNGDGKVISTPKVTTLNGAEAVISQGTKIPYQTVSDEGTKTEFEEAVLELKVTPVINPDQSVILTIEAKNNTPSITEGASAPSIDKKEAKTKVLVKDGETTVIGGIYVERENDSVQGLPFFMDLPFVGQLFRSNVKARSKVELMIFITPRILN